MSAIFEYECQVCVDGYDVITDYYPDEDPRDKRRAKRIGRLLLARSKRIRRFDLFKNTSSAFLEYATLTTEDGIKDFTNRYGPLYTPMKHTEPIVFNFSDVRAMRRMVKLWEMSNSTSDYSKLNRAVQKTLIDETLYDSPTGVTVELRLKEDPLSGSARLSILPHTLLHALWVQLVLAIDGNVSLRACVQCRKWFTLEAGRGRSDKEYCSDACRMRAYRKRKARPPGAKK